MASNNLSDLNDMLFNQLVRLDKDDIKDDELKKEIDRSKAMNGIAHTIVDNARVVLLYEKEHHCHLKRGQLVIFLDGDRSNFDLSNLMIVTRKEAAIINHERLQIKGNQELSKSGVLVAKLKLKIKEKSNEGARK